MGFVAYFTAVIARSGKAWRARDVEVDDATSLEDLTDGLRAVSVGDQPVLAVIEHEDEWLLLAPAADVDSADDPDAADEDEDDDDEGSGEDEQEEDRIAAWAGETDLLEDFGVSGRTLRKLVEENGEDPGAVLAEVGETVGFGELLDALR
jgi:putative tRNA adenosine deaminase-associated protein